MSQKVLGPRSVSIFTRRSFPREWVGHLGMRLITVVIRTWLLYPRGPPAASSAALITTYMGAAAHPGGVAYFTKPGTTLLGATLIATVPCSTTTVALPAVTRGHSAAAVVGS